jgi:hypothetical protein
VRQPLGSSTARLQFAAPINAVSDFRLQLRELLDRARAAAPDQPLTSLEEDIASRGRASKHHETASKHGPNDGERSCRT